MRGGFNKYSNEKNDDNIEKEIEINSNSDFDFRFNSDKKHSK
jgi:hypothetical protein